MSQEFKNWNIIEQSIQNPEKFLIETRRKLHQNPELSYQEFETSKLVANFLKSWGYEVKTGFAITGLVGILKNGEGPVVMIRADMDALPIKEMIEWEYKSTKKAMLNGKEVDVSHACGHDAHTSIALTTAKVLAENKNLLKGMVVFVFQPNEEGTIHETLLGSGAAQMIKDGLYNAIPKPDVVFGLHVWHSQKGQIRLEKGYVFSNADFFTIKLTGTQSHGAAPWNGKDPIVTASEIIAAFQTIISREIDLTKGGAVITVGSIHAGNRPNIIPQDLEMQGTIRCFDKENRNLIYESFKKKVQSISEMNGVKSEVKIEHLTPAVYNHPEITDFARQSLTQRLGKDFVQQWTPLFAADDCAYFLERTQGLYFFLGIAPDDNIHQPAIIHSPHFFINESALIFGVKTFCSLTFDFMYSKK